MKFLLYPFAVSFVLGGCSASEHALATFSYNGTSLNSLIVGRRPQYGDGQPDGCIVMTAISLQLKTVSADSIAGIVQEAGTNQPIAYATVHIFQSDPATPILLMANSAGRFIVSRSWQVKRITASFIGYRELTVDLAHKRLY